MIGIALNGRMAPEANTTPLAANLSVRLGDSSLPLFDFSLALGPDRLPFIDGSPTSFTCCGPDAWVAANWEERSAPIIPPEYSDGVYDGVLDSKASREVALATRRFDHYFGGDVSTPISIEILTVEPRWLPDPKGGLKE